MKYKIGDKVKIKSNLIINDFYGTEPFIEEMKNSYVTIRSIKSNNYLVKENEYCYSDEMLDGIYKETVKIEKDGEKVKVKGLNIQELESNNPNKFYIFSVDHSIGKNMKQLVNFRDTIAKNLGTTNFSIIIGDKLNITE